MIATITVHGILTKRPSYGFFESTSYEDRSGKLNFLKEANLGKLLKGIRLLPAIMYVPIRLVSH